MGNSKSKPQFPQPHPAPAQGYIPYGAGYPYGQTMYGPGYAGPGFVPPGFGAQAQVSLPQPQIWQPPARDRDRERRKKSRRKQKSSSTHAHATTQPDLARGPPPDTQQQPQPSEFYDLPAGFVPQAFTPNPPGAQVPTHAQSAGRRAATPFRPSVQVEDVDEDENDDDDMPHPDEYSQPTRDTSHRRKHSRSQSQRSNARPILDPLPPIDPNDLAPPGPPNPLPRPPKDLYDMTPYKKLLDLPSTVPLITGRTGNTANMNMGRTMTMAGAGGLAGLAGVGAGMNAVVPPLQKKKKSRSLRKSLFGFGKNSKDQQQQQQQQPQQYLQTNGLPNVQFVPVYINPNAQDTHPMRGLDAQNAASGSQPPVQPSQQPPPAVVPSADDDGDELPPGHGVHPFTSDPPTSPPPEFGQGPDDPSQFPNVQYQHQHQPSHLQQDPMMPSQHQHQPSHPQQDPMMPSQQQQPPAIIEFDQSSHPEFLNHSWHRVMFANLIWPTATHLYEAFKFIDHRPDIAERIRQRPSAREVYPISATFQNQVRPDWGSIFLDKMEEVVYKKFDQHRPLRTLLLNTGDAELVYADPRDPYWGTGRPLGNVTATGEIGPGKNELGKVLMKVRSTLRDEGDR